MGLTIVVILSLNQIRLGVIILLLENFEEFKQYDTHSHILTHSKSYRDILYDMYIDKK